MRMGARASHNGEKNLSAAAWEAVRGRAEERGEPDDNVATSGGTCLMGWFEFEMSTEEPPEQTKGQAESQAKIKSPALALGAGPQ